QTRRNQDAAAAIELEIGCMADHQALQAARHGIEGRQTAQLELDLFPLRKRIDEQATICAIHGCNEASIRTLDDALAIARRHREPAFRIEGFLVCTAEHAESRTG